MTATLREALARRADDAGRPDLDIAELVALGEARLRRRRLVAGAGAAAVVVCLVVGVALTGPVTRGDGPPVTSPSPSAPSPSASPTDTRAPHVRELFYIDVDAEPPHDNGTIHLGDRTITSDNAFVHTDVTDDGFVWTSRDEVWFSDGGDPEKIGSQQCGAVQGDGRRRAATDEVLTGASGSLAVWFECADTASPALVVYDTGARREVVRRPMPACALDAGCGVDAVFGDHIYYVGSSSGARPSRYRYDVATGVESPATARSFADDVRSNPRGLVVGDTWETARLDTAEDGLRRWDVVGTRLVPIAGNAARDWPTTAFDTGTHQAVHLVLPPGYTPRGTSFALVQWLDDATVALASGHNLDSADIITCRLSDGRCRLAVPASPDTIRLAPAQSLPG